MRLVALAFAGLVLALFECWAAALPPEEADRLEFCRFSAALDCVKSVQLQGRDLDLFGLPALPALAGLFSAILLLAGFAATGRDGDGAAGWARILGFPAAGLALFQLADHAMAARCTSVDAILLAGAAVSLAVSALLRRAGGPALRAALPVAAFGALFGILVGGCVGAAGAAKVEQAAFEKEAAARPATVLWPEFAEEMPRQGAPFLGAELAPRELLLFLDPATAAGKALLRAALRLAPEFGARVRIVLYAPGTLLYRAAAEGRTLECVRALAEGAPPPALAADVDALAARIERKREQLGFAFGPTAVFRGGSETGSFDLRDLLDRAAR